MHKTTAAPFSLRARERPTVAAPLRWSEVAAVVDGTSPPDDLLMVTDQVLDEKSERRKLAEPLLKQKQRIPDLKEMFG